MALTLKQEEFCQNIVMGCTQLESYRRAYDAENMTDNTASCEAYKLINSPHIAHRIAELRELIALKTLWPLSQRLATLKDIADTSDKDSARVSAIKVGTDIIGDGAALKNTVEHSGEISTGNVRVSIVGRAASNSRNS